MIALYTTRVIMPEEELLSDYGFDYWKNHPTYFPDPRAKRMAQWEHTRATQWKRQK
jgi:SET domain-containing protein